MNIGETKKIDLCGMEYEVAWVYDYYITFKNIHPYGFAFQQWKSTDWKYTGMSFKAHPPACHIAAAYQWMLDNVEHKE